MKSIKDNLKVQTPKKLYFYCISLGVFIGLCTVLFSIILHHLETLILGEFTGISDINFQNFFIQSLPKLPHWYLIFLPMFGGILVSVISYFIPEAMGAGTDNMVDVFHNNEGTLAGKNAPAVMATTIAALSTGASGGKEGPIAVIGGSIGSFFAKWLGQGARARRTLLLAGTAAGLGAIFRAPLGGALTAVEVLYKEDSESDSLIPCIIASISAYIITIICIPEGGRIIEVDTHIMVLNDYREIIIYAVLGVVCVIFGRLYLWIMELSSSFFSNMSLPKIWHPMIGGLIVGIIGYFVPIALGSGFEHIHDLAVKEIYNAANICKISVVLGILILAKMSATSITVKSGLAGGMFGPSFVIGGFIGALTGTIAEYIFPGIVGSTAPYILVGMGSFFAGVAHAPLASLIMMTELTGSYELLPAILVSISVVIVFTGKKTLYPSQVKNKFISPSHLWDMKINVLRYIKVKECSKFLRNIAVIDQYFTIEKLEAHSKMNHISDYIIVNKTSQFQGYISLRHINVEDAINQLVVVANIMDTTIATCKLSDNLADILENILKTDMDKIAVVNDDNLFIGYLRYHDILHIYTKEVSK